jgi:predicted metal-dependent HD superfamily phosphohydrolase
MMQDSELTELSLCWSETVSTFSTDQQAHSAVFTETASRYSEPRRAYHNLTHIKALLEQAEALRDQIQDYAAVRLAIWFHDVIYDTRRSDNEERSAEFAAAAMNRLSVPADTSAAVQSMILATRGHSLMNASDDLKLFLDLDLSILGAQEEIYQAYSAAIRQEYAWVPGFLYRRERRKILNAFLQRDQLYHTRVMAARFEAQARRNIANEINSL